MKKYIKGKDYCTNFPDKIGTDYSFCCYQHDQDYTKGSAVSKWKADRKLFHCVKANRGPIVASTMWLGVTLFGWRYFKRS